VGWLLRCGVHRFGPRAFWAAGSGGTPRTRRFFAWYAVPAIHDPSSDYSGGAHRYAQRD
jgi:hypothetical protein